MQGLWAFGEHSKNFLSTTWTAHQPPTDRLTSHMCMLIVEKVFILIQNSLHHDAFDWAPAILSIDVLIQNWTTTISHVCVNIIEQEMRKGQIVVGRIELEKSTIENWKSHSMRARARLQSLWTSCKWTIMAFQRYNHSAIRWLILFSAYISCTTNWHDPEPLLHTGHIHRKLIKFIRYHSNHNKK